MQDQLVRILLPRCLPVPAQCPRLGEHLLDLGFHLLRPQPVRPDVSAAALRALARHAALVSAAMTQQLVAARRVKRERRLAARAAQHVSAVAAEHVGGAAAAVQEQDRLLLAPEDIGQRCLQVAAEARTVAGLQFLAHVHDLHRGKVQCRRRRGLRLGRDALGEQQQHGLAAIGSIPLHHARRRRPEDADRSAHARVGFCCPRRIIERRLGLVERGIVAFVHNDQSDVWQRRERARCVVRSPLAALLPARGARCRNVRRPRAANGSARPAPESSAQSAARSAGSTRSQARVRSPVVPQPPRPARP